MTEGLINGKAYQAPHCNSEVLHAPGRCVYCDHFPERQMMREASGTPFTPDEANGWSGNTAAPAGVPHTHMGSTWVPEYDVLEVDGSPVGLVPTRPRMRTKLGRAAWDALRGHGRSRTRDAGR